VKERAAEEIRTMQSQLRAQAKKDHADMQQIKGAVKFDWKIQAWDYMGCASPFLLLLRAHW
jgi:hypothetical protein